MKERKKGREKGESRQERKKMETSFIRKKSGNMTNCILHLKKMQTEIWPILICTASR